MAAASRGRRGEGGRSGRGGRVGWRSEQDGAAMAGVASGCGRAGNGSGRGGWEECSSKAGRGLGDAQQGGRGLGDAQQGGEFEKKFCFLFFFKINISS